MFGFKLPKLTTTNILMIGAMLIVVYMFLNKGLTEGYTMYIPGFMDSPTKEGYASSDQWHIPQFFEKTNFPTRTGEALIGQQWLEKQSMKIIGNNLIREM